MVDDITDDPSPTPEEVLAWGYDDELHFIEQDEDLLLDDPIYVPTLLALAADDSCPKQKYCFYILCQFTRESILWNRESSIQWNREAFIPVLEQNRKDSQQLTGELVQEWANYLDRLLSYRAAGTVRMATALERSQDLLVGPGRRGIVKATGKQLPGWWEFVLVTSVTEYLYIEQETGRFRYSHYVPWEPAR